MIKANKYEPEINRSFLDFAEHYNTVILPAGALHPQDKALAENFVRNAYRQIFALLRNRVFFSLGELNHALWEQPEIYNNKCFQKRDYSRTQLFNNVEKHQLKPLVAEYYELKSFNRCKVQYNHHVYLKDDKHFYSVPFQYTEKQVRVSYTSSTVEIYYNNNRIALHKRNRYAYGYITDNNHRPKNHQFQAEWTPSRFINWARNIAPEIEQIVTAIFDSRKHPEQELELFKLPEHDNIRGKEHYN